jgi:hypothetical protein
MRPRRPGARTAGILALLVGTAGLLGLTPPAAQAASGCEVTYSVASQWSDGFVGSIAVTNLADSTTSWTLTWEFTAGQQVNQGWSATYTQSGSRVTARSLDWNGNLGTGASTTIGFSGKWNGSTNPVPSSFSLNGTLCTGQTTPTTGPGPTTEPTTPPTTDPTAALPSSFRWSSSAALISAKSDSSHSINAVKDPSLVYANGAWHVFATTVTAGGSYNMEYLTFADWGHAGAANPTFLDTTPIGSGYRAAPQVFYFAPQSTWYLVYQTGNASYSTNRDISNPSGWTAPRDFYSGMPDIIKNNIGSGYWVDMWVICDTAKCYLFSSDDNGHLYRSETTVADFPNGFSEPVIAMQDSNPNNLFEASNIYKVQGTNTYLMLVEAIGSDGRRYFRSWTAPAITGPWTQLAASEANPFARANNVTFTGTAWTNSISHGELVRATNDQTLTISPCGLQLLYQGLDPSAGGDYNSLPWRLGLLTQTGSTC